MHRLNELSRDVRYRRAAAIGGFAILGLAASDDGGFVLCPFRRCTGGYCPGCGATRATGALLRGDVARSWQLHPFIAIAALQLALFGAVWAMVSTARRSVMRRWVQPVLILNTVLLLGVWVARVVTHAIPTPFGW